MNIYGLFSIGSNDLDYEDFISWNKFVGIFDSLEEAKNYAELTLNTIKEYCEPDGCFRVIEDWHWDDDRYKKRVLYSEYGIFDSEYVIEKLTINPEFKEDK